MAQKNVEVPGEFLSIINFKVRGRQKIVRLFEVSEFEPCRFSQKPTRRRAMMEGNEKEVIPCHHKHQGQLVHYFSEISRVE
jgi:hypothetical protein